MMKTDYRTIALAACAAVIVAAPIAYAQVATTLEQAELAGLTSEKKAEQLEGAYPGISTLWRDEAT